METSKKDLESAQPEPQFMFVDISALRFVMGLPNHVTLYKTKRDNLICSDIGIHQNENSTIAEGNCYRLPTKEEIEMYNEALSRITIRSNEY